MLSRRLRCPQAKQKRDSNTEGQKYFNWYSLQLEIELEIVVVQHRRTPEPVLTQYIGRRPDPPRPGGETVALEGVLAIEAVGVIINHRLKAGAYIYVSVAIRDVECEFHPAHHWVQVSSTNPAIQCARHRVEMYATTFSEGVQRM